MLIANFSRITVLLRYDYGTITKTLRKRYGKGKKNGNTTVPLKMNSFLSFLVAERILYVKILNK